MSRKRSVFLRPCRKQQHFYPFWSGRKCTSQLGTDAEPRPGPLRVSCGIERLGRCPAHCVLHRWCLASVLQPLPVWKGALELLFLTALPATKTRLAHFVKRADLN